jgi:hypothetical protein
MLRRRLTISIAAGAAVVVVAGGGYGIVSASSGGSSAAASARPAAKAGSNARSGPSAGGVVGTVAGRSGSTFTVSTSAGQKVTVHEASSTAYQKGTGATSASAVTTGASVLVLGTTSGTTITATQVILHPTGSGAPAGKVIAFKRGAPATSKQVGQIPANYSEGSGTIVSATTADKATEAALTAYPGGIVDRVVRLSNGDYEVHYIGVNWPHHIFVDQDFKVIGAD